MRACAEQIFTDLQYLRLQKFSFNFYRNKNSFFRRASYGVYISQLIRFARVCNHVTEFNARNKCLTAKLLQQGNRYQTSKNIF